MANYVYSSATMTALRRAVLENIKQHRGERNIIIVPDQFSLTIEREVLEILDCDCCFDIEVVSFSRYADKVIGRRGNLLNKQTSVMLLSRVIIENADKLLYYGKAAMHKGFAEELYAVITNFRNSGANVAKLESAIIQLKGFARNKLNDILLLYKGYVKALNEYRDMTTMLELLRDKLKTDCNVVGTNYYITDFYDMAQVKYEIVEVLADRAKNLYAGILDDCGRNKHIYNSRYAAKILSLTNTHRDEVIKIDVQLSEDKRYIKENIFAYGINCLKFGSQYVEICEARNTESEIEYVAMDIRRRVIRDGLRYRDFAVAVPDVTIYSEAMQRIFNRYSIPYFIDKKYLLTEHTCYKTLKYAVTASSLKQQDILNLIKEKGFGISDTESHAFENYILKFNISGEYFNKEFNETVSENVRLKALAAISAANLVGQNHVTASMLADGILKFYKAVGITATLNIMNETADELQRSINTQVMDKILDVADDMRSLFGDITAPINVFYDILFNGLESVKFSTVPLYIDCVFIGDGNDSRYGDMRTLYMLGANEGAYPTPCGGNGIISDIECSLLASCGVEIQSAVDRANANKICLQQLMLKPDRLIVTAKASGFDSLLKLQLQSLFMLSPIRVSPLIEDKTDAEDIGYAAATRQNFELSTANGRIRVGALTENEEKNHDAGMDVYASRVGDIAFYDNKISASGIEKFYTCPYMFFCEKILRLKERDIAGEKINDIGTLMHEVLEKFYSEKYFERGAEAIDASVREIINECFEDDKYSMLLRSGGRAVKSAMTRRACKIVKSIDANRRNSEYKPSYFEYEFGKDKKSPGYEVLVGNTTYDIGGFIDRIDLCDSSMAVIDYKSSVKDVDILSVKRGYMLQLPLYTYIAARNLNKKPSAMLYMTMPGKYVKENKYSSAAVCTGFVVADEAEALKLDINDASDTSGYLPPRNKYDKNGAVKGKQFRISSEDFDRYGNFAIDLIIKAVELCETHELEPTPIKNACDYCKYVNVCGRANDPKIIREKH